MSDVNPQGCEVFFVGAAIIEAMKRLDLLYSKVNTSPPRADRQDLAGGPFLEKAEAEPV